MEDGLLRTYHASLQDVGLSRKRQVSHAARLADRRSMGYAAASTPCWQEVELLVQSDVTLLRNQLAALPLWDPELQERLRRARFTSEQLQLSLLQGLLKVQDLEDPS